MGEATPRRRNGLGKPTQWNGLKSSWRYRGRDQSRGVGCPIRESRADGTSLVVQWLRLCAPNAGGLGLILGQGTRSYMQQLKDSAYHREDGRSQVQPHKYLKKKKSWAES